MYAVFHVTHSPPPVSRPVHPVIQRRAVPFLSSAHDRPCEACDKQQSLSKHTAAAAAAAVQLQTNHDYCSPDYPFNRKKKHI